MIKHIFSIFAISFSCLAFAEFPEYSHPLWQEDPPQIFNRVNNIEEQLKKIEDLLEISDTEDSLVIDVIRYRIKLIRLNMCGFETY